MTDFVCVFKLVVDANIVDCSKDSCSLWDSVQEKCSLVSPAYWAKIDHAQPRSNLTGKVK